MNFRITCKFYCDQSNFQRENLTNLQLNFIETLKTKLVLSRTGLSMQNKSLLPTNHATFPILSTYIYLSVSLETFKNLRFHCSSAERTSEKQSRTSSETSKKQYLWFQAFKNCTFPALRRENGGKAKSCLGNFP